MITMLAVLTLTALAGMLLLGAGYLRVLGGYRDLNDRYGQLKQRVLEVEQELGALCNASLGAGDHLVKLEQRMHRVLERQENLEMRASSELPYAQASQLVTKGADIDELVDTCGLTRGEAELLVMMQRGTA